MKNKSIFVKANKSKAEKQKISWSNRPYKDYLREGGEGFSVAI